jgi:endonuclease III
VEHAVGELFERRDWNALSQHLIFHGRRICHARKPACGACPVATLCPSYGEGETDPAKARALLKYELAPGRRDLLELMLAGKTRRELRALGYGLDA